MYEWFSLSYIPGAYLKQTSPPYKPETIRLTASIYQEVAVHAASTFNLSHLRSHYIACNPREIFECTHLKFTVSGQSKQASKQTYTRMCAMKSH